MIRYWKLSFFWDHRLKIHVTILEWMTPYFIGSTTWARWLYDYLVALLEKCLLIFQVHYQTLFHMCIHFLLILLSVFFVHFASILIGTVRDKPESLGNRVGLTCSKKPQVLMEGLGPCDALPDPRSLLHVPNCWLPDKTSTVHWAGEQYLRDVNEHAAQGLQRGL